MQDKDDPRKNTHLWIVVQALQMVGTLSGPPGAAAKALIALTDLQVAQLHQGIWDADFESPWKDYGWAYHFYDPDKGTSYLPCILYPETCHQTARVWGAKCFNASLDAYKGRDFATAVYQLGLSLHYLTDVGQPMHAANFTNLSNRMGYHHAFEAHVLQWTNATSPPAIPYVQTITAVRPEAYIDAAARLAKPRKSIICGVRAQDAWWPIQTDA